MPAVLLVALTGGIGSGKSTVARMLAERGAVILDADAIAREVVEPGRPALERIVERFGPGVLDASGRLDRPALGGIVFDDESARRDLEAITHPAIGEEMASRMAAAPPDAGGVFDIPLLAESGRAGERGYQAVVVVETPAEVRLDRLEGRGLAREDAEARMAAQAGDAERRAIATHVVDNSGDEAALARRVDELWSELTAS